MDYRHRFRAATETNDQEDGMAGGIKKGKGGRRGEMVFGVFSRFGVCMEVEWDGDGNCEGLWAWSNLLEDLLEGGNDPSKQAIAWLADEDRTCFL